MYTLMIASLNWNPQFLLAHGDFPHAADHPYPGCVHEVFGTTLERLPVFNQTCKLSNSGYDAVLWTVVGIVAVLIGVLAASLLVSQKHKRKGARPHD